MENQLEDLEEHEVRASVPPDTPAADSAGDSAATSAPSSGGGTAAAMLLTNPAEVLDAEEATKISMQRITCVTTVRRRPCDVLGESRVGCEHNLLTALPVVAGVFG